MTPEAQRLAIAEACGWTEFRQLQDLDMALPLNSQGLITSTRLDSWLGLPPWANASHPSLIGESGKQYKPDQSWWGTLPDYLHDLNACQAFVDVLKKRGLDDLDRYYRCLSELVYNRRPEAEFFSLAYVAHATAAQRAEAFLRTIGKWEEPTP